MKTNQQFQTLAAVRSPPHLRIMAALLATFLVTVFVALTLIPWQQNVTASGSVVAFNPTERRQFLEAPVDGRIVRWAVVEGDQVKRGELLVEISDNDPQLMERMTQERGANEAVLQAAHRKAATVREKIARLETVRDRSVAAATAKLDVASDKIAAAGRALEAAQANLETAELNLARQERLEGKGLASRRAYELALLARNQATASVEKARADLNAERNARVALEAEREKVQADSDAKIEEARSSLESALAEAQKSIAELTKIDVRLARQSTQRVMAPFDGVVFRVVAGLGGSMVKGGDPLAELVPMSGDDVVELWVKGNDAPLVSTGRAVRLQFEGWPALQFAGWPSIAVGTFGGRVLFVDAADDGMGRFRVLVGPDPEDQPWPEARYLRQGVRANGWLLLDEVTLGYELWRQFNGFPPATTAPSTVSGKEAGGRS